MADTYNLFRTNSVFSEESVNEMCDIIFGYMKEHYPHSLDHLFIGGGVGLILQGKEPYLIKDIDLIVTDRSIFEKLSVELPKLFTCTTHVNYLRFWLKTDKIWFEFWYVDKHANLVDYNGIKLELNTDILKYK